MNRRPPPDLDLVQRLHAAGLHPTRQRLAVAAVMLARPVHLTAEQVLEKVQAGAAQSPDAMVFEEPRVSRATVYATLAQFAEAGLLRELHTGAGAVVYDSNVTPHHHCVDVDTGQVHDLPAGACLSVTGIDTLPAGLQVEDVQVMVRVRAVAA